MFEDKLKKSGLPEMPSEFQSLMYKKEVAHRFEKTYCSMCGNDFGPASAGYSHCSDHDPVGGRDAEP